MHQSSSEHIQLLSSSPERVAMLGFLGENPSDPRDIAGMVSKSRRCVQRDLSKFEDRGWVEKQEGAYRLTTYGAAIVAEYTDLASAISIIDRYESLFAHLPEPEHLPDPRWLREAKIAVADSDRPHSPLNLYVDGIRGCSTDRIRGIAPVFSQTFSDAHSDLLERGVETELITDMKTIKTSRSTNAEEFATSLRLDALSVYMHEESVEFGLALADDRGFLGAYDEEGRFVACVEFTGRRFSSGPRTSTNAIGSGRSRSATMT